jgi:hypothetical protein
MPIVDASIVRRIKRETDGEFVAAIMDCLQRPFRSRNPQVDCSEKSVADRVQDIIYILRGGSPFVGRYSQEEGRKLIKLLRKCGYDQYADTIEQIHHITWAKPAPARSNQIKFKCACHAYDLITTYTEQKPTKTKNGTFQEIAALFYRALTGEDTDREKMERQCALVIEDVKKSTRLAEARRARNAGD